jgi:hypothetical protein
LIFDLIGLIEFVLQLLNFYLIQCQLTSENDHQLDYIDVKYIPPILHNDNIYLTVLYKCSSLSQRRISLIIRIEKTLYRTNLIVFRRYWYCQRSSHIQTRYLRVHLHRSLAYASDIQSNLQSWPIEHGQLTLIMYNNKQQNDNEILKKIDYNVRFLSVHKRPNIRSLRWNPLINKPTEGICLVEPGKVFLINIRNEIII